MVRWLTTFGLLTGLLVAFPQSAPASGKSSFALSRALAAPWPGLQRSDGTFKDVVRPQGSPHGDAVLGYGLLLTGVRQQNRRLVRSGTRAITAATGRLDPWSGTRGFKVWAVAASYNFAAKRLRRRPGVPRAMGGWAAWLRHQSTTHLGLNGYENKFLVDAVAVLELQRTGLRSKIPGTVLGSAWWRSRALARRLINRRVQAMTSVVLSDPPANPLAYHALSYGMYARAVRLLGGGASRRARALLRRLGRESWLLTAPDGDVAYWGRSLAQRWTFAATAYGLAATAQAFPRSAWPRRAATLTGRLHGRLRSYGVGPNGEWVTPGLRQNLARGRKGIDGYTNAVVSTGLTLIFLDWAVGLDPPGKITGAIPADRPMSVILGRGTGRFAVVRHANLWYAVKEFGSNNLRYDFGPVAVKRFVDGKWEDVIPLRPLGFGSAGPTLHAHGGSWIPSGTQTTLGPGGVVQINGGYRRKRRWIRRGVDFRVEPVSCGVSLGVRAQSGDQLVFSAFLRGRATLEQKGEVFSSGTQAIAVNSPLSAVFVDRHLYASASDSTLTRARFATTAQGAKYVTMTLC